MDHKYSIDIHEQALNLAGLIILQHQNQDHNQKYIDFIGTFRQDLNKLTNFYAHAKISKLES